MTKITNLATDIMVTKVGIKAIRWLYCGKNRNEFIRYHSDSRLRCNLSRRALRDYLNHTLAYIISSRRGTDTVEKLGYYTVTSNEGSNYVTVKRTPGRIPSNPGQFSSWVDWDVQTRASYTGDKIQQELELVFLRHVVEWYFCGPLRYKKEDTHSALLLSTLSVLSQIMLQGLFDPLGDLNLEGKPLPAEDLRCRVGNYHMLYDHLAEEWRLWMSK